MSPLPPLGLKSFAPAFTLEGNYYALSTITVPSGGLSTITFAGIPTGYKHLELQLLARSTRVNAGDYMFMRFNGDTATNYSKHHLAGDGSGVGAGASSTVAQIELNRIAAASASTNVFGAGVIKLLEYSNSNIYKTTRATIGYDNNGSGEIYFQSGNWRNTSAITSITLTCDANFAQYSQFALYGVK